MPLGREELLFAARALKARCIGATGNLVQLNAEQPLDLWAIGCNLETMGRGHAPAEIGGAELKAIAKGDRSVLEPLDPGRRAAVDQLIAELEMFALEGEIVLPNRQARRSAAARDRKLH